MERTFWTAVVVACLGAAVPQAGVASRVLVIGIQSPRGLEPELARAIGAALHSRVAFRHVPHPEGYFSPGRKPWDIGLDQIALRSGAHPPLPVVGYMHVSDVVLLRRGLDQPVHSLSDLRWVRICARAGTPAARIVTARINPVVAAWRAPSDAAVAHALAGGRCDAAIGDIQTLAAERLAAPALYGRFAGRIAEGSDYVIVLSPQSALARSVPRIIRALSMRHVLRGLVRKSLGVDVGSLPVLKEGPNETTVTFIGDSVSAALNWTPNAQPLLARGLRLRWEAKSCRRLEAPSCGSPPPPTALETIRSERSALGQVVVMDVGYNDAASTYAAELDTAMRAMLTVGVRHVIWVTMRERFPYYHLMNEVIRNARRRWPQLVVADWNGFSNGKPWFASDGIHLNASGAYGLARLLRPFLAPLVR